MTYSLDATSAASFDIDEFSGQLQTKADLDHEDKSRYTVTVSVSDSKDANGDADDATDDTIRVTIQVANLNEDPEFPSSETGMRSTDENTGAGMNIGTPVAATDPENDNLTYSLDAVDAASFNIDASSGQLRTKSRAGLRNWDHQLQRGRHRRGPVRRGRPHHGHHHGQQRR